MTENERATVQAVIHTLDSLTVTGRENMSKLLGCIGALEELLEIKEEKYG